MITQGEIKKSKMTPQATNEIVIERNMMAHQISTMRTKSFEHNWLLLFDKFQLETF